MGYMHPGLGNEHECVDIDECDMFDNLCVFGRSVFFNNLSENCVVTYQIFLYDNSHEHGGRL